MRSLLPSLRAACWCLLLGCLQTVLPSTVTVTVASTSIYVGAQSNYTITLTNQTQVTQVTLSFNAWTNNTINPFSTATKMIISSSSFTPVGFPGSMVVNLGTTISGNTFQFTLTNMQNPSSTKPYLFNITLNNGSATATYQGNLTCSNISNSTFGTIGYSSAVGATSSVVQLYLTPSYALMLNNSNLKITYDNVAFTISLATSSYYTTISGTAGALVIGKFQVQSYGLLEVQVSISNPQAALTSTINCLFYLNDSSGINNIQAEYLTITLTPADFTTLTTSTALYYGVTTSLAVVSVSPFNQLGNGSSYPAYTTLTYNSTQLQIQSGSNCNTTVSTGVCQYSITGSYSLTNILPSIGAFTSTSITITTYTYFQSAYYPLCQSQLTLTYSMQIIAPTANTAVCSSNIVAQPNNISLSMKIGSVAAGDLVYIDGLGGAPYSSWTQTTIGSTIWYYYTVSASNIAVFNSTTSTLTVPLSFNNPTYTMASNSISAVNIYRAGTVYASSTTTTPVCPVTTGLAITTSSISSSASTTYSPTNLELDMSMQLFDYKAGDYMVLNFKSSSFGNSYVLGAAYQHLVYTATINGIAVTITSINTTAAKLVFVAQALPSLASPFLKVIINNLTNPPIKDTLWVQTVTYQGVTGGTKETLTSGTLAVTPGTVSCTAANLQLLANDTVSLALSNPYRNLSTINSSVTSSSVKITVPTQMVCSGVTNSSLTVTWNIGVLTSGTYVNGNTTNLNVVLGICYVSFFTGTISYSITQTYSGIASTSTTTAISNLCGDGCYQCSSSLCTACFNSTYSNYTFLYSGSCFGSCPKGSYQSAVGMCTSCHPSCGSCTASYYTNCSTCATSFITTSAGYCLSVCGPGQYLNGSSCLNCDPDCTACLSSTLCYVCKTNATLIGTVCQFTSCFSPCLTCSGTQATCLTCVSPYSLYQSQCYSSCPSGTYQTSRGGQSVCDAITQSSSYIPISIVGLVGMLAILALRAYSNKKIGNESRRSRSYKNEEESQLNYKINMWRVGAVLYAYLQLAAGIVLIAKNAQYGLNVGSSAIVGVGLGLHGAANIAFLIGYYCIVAKNRVQNVGDDQSQQQRNSSLRNKIIVALSALISYRTYKLLYSNLFLQRNTSTQLRNTDKGIYPNEQSINPIPKLTSTQPNIAASGGSMTLQPTRFKQQSAIVSKGKGQEAAASKKPFVYSSQVQQPGQLPILKPVDSVRLTQTGSLLLQNKRFNHPFLSYLTLVNLISGTVVILVGCCLQIEESTFINMLFWGIDAVIVTVFSLGLSSWDLWNFANLTREEQHSQMSSASNEANFTHENLKQAAEVEVQVELGIQPKNPRRSSPRKVGSIQNPKSSNRSNKSKQAEKPEQPEPIPMLKVFQDFQEKDDAALPEAKTKKFSTKNLRYGGGKIPAKRYPSITNTRKNMHGQLCDDLYINFPSYKIQKQNSTTSYYRSRRSVSPQRSLREPEVTMEGDLHAQDDQFLQQPPNFADISQIEQKKVQVAHSSEMGEVVVAQQLQ